MDKKTLEHFQKIKRLESQNQRFRKQCKELEKDIAKMQAMVDNLPALETISDSHQRLIRLDAEQKLINLKSSLSIARSSIAINIHELEKLGVAQEIPKIVEPGE